jgi:hypothetical protein
VAAKTMEREMGHPQEEGRSTMNLSLSLSPYSSNTLTVAV